MIYKRIDELVGNTPVIQIPTDDDMADLYLKLEWYNPAGSIKDRIAKNMIEAAEEEGLLQPGDTIVEPTSGNTGIGIAMIAAAKGYKAILTMPDSLSIERRKILRGYGATLILTPAEKGIKESIKVAEELVRKHGYFMPMQFENINNPKAHMRFTSKEIINDLPTITHFVAAVGTGGTVTGVGSALKQYDSNILIYAVEPENSAVLSGEEPGKHKIQGIGAGFIPDILDTSVYDDIFLIKDEEAFDTARELARDYGLFVGISTGANVAASRKLCKQIGPKNKVLTISPSNAERYLSTPLFEQSE